MLVVLSLQFTTQEMIEPDVILLPQQAQNLTLKKQEIVVVGVQVPAPVNIDQQNSFYSQLAFQARAAVDFDCQIKFIGFQTNQTYAKYNNSDIFKTFAILLTQEQNEKSQFVYVNVSSSCNVQVELVVAAVHQLDFSVQSLTKEQPESTIFVHRKARGINRRVQFEIDTDSMVMIYVCSTPLILDLAWMDCKYYISEGKEIFNIEVETSLYDPNIEYIYYTVAYCNIQICNIILSQIQLNNLIISNIENFHFCQMIHVEILKNIPGLKWTPGISPFLQQKSPAELKHLFKPNKSPNNSQLMQQPNTFKQSLSRDVPDFLDWSTSNPHCVDFIRDMKNCGTSQVFASISVLSDLRCIKKLDSELEFIQSLIF
ncbi:Cathepsin_B [Hexamita inflata]|uniref:Cathepsin B n=1 Tax=Hexamita inflata TaxID=28002 RepID=A0AA86PI39_9EUKA|nr:Cathepsin B [Hexamita inflata]